MTAVLAADSTYAKIEQKIRRLTASASEAVLTSADIQEGVNTFYSQDFPYAIKLDQLRDVYTIFTSPNVDRYPLDVNTYQGVREPIYFEGIQGYFFKDRDQFFKMWPRFPTLSVPDTGDGVTFVYNFTSSQIPFLPGNVVIGSIDAITGNAIRIEDSPNKGLFDPLVWPFMTTNNLGITGLLNLVVSDSVGNLTYKPVGTVNYVTGVFTIDFSQGVGSAPLVIPANNAPINLWVSQYEAGRPYTTLFWNNEFTIRPVPDKTYKVEVEIYQTPVQFLDTTDDPKIQQWWQYLAYGAAMEILRERQDMEGVENLMEGFRRQEALVLERQGVEEIGQRNTTIFTRTVEAPSFGSGQGWY